MKRDTMMHTFKIALQLCLVCSMVVAVAAVTLRSRQKANQELEKKKNILIAAGLFDEQTGGIVVDGEPRSDLTVLDLFEEAAESADRPTVEEKIIDLETGREIDEATVTRIEAEFGGIERYETRKASRDATGSWSSPVPSDEDVASLKRRERYSPVYLVRGPDGALQQVILPIRGYGLWSTLWGFIALDADLVTIRGITYYEHGETPGLGGEVDNPSWKRQWQGKQAFDNGDVAIRVIKGSVDDATPNPEHKVDGLAGATITAKGVSNMLQYWLGENGFQPFLERLKRDEADAGKKGGRKEPAEGDGKNDGRNDEAN